MRGNPINEQLNRARVWIPVKQGVFTLIGTGLTGWAATTVYTNHAPELAWIPIAFAAGTLYMMHRFEAVNNPGRKQAKPVQFQARTWNDTTTVLVAKTRLTERRYISRGAFVFEKATIPVDRIRVFAFNVYHGAEVDFKTWTSNSGIKRGKQPFFNKQKEFIPLRDLLLDHRMLEHKVPTNKFRGVYVTDYGKEYLLDVIKKNDPLTPQEFDQAHSRKGQGNV